MEITDIRAILRECENSIVFAIFERSRWKSNPSAYTIDASTGKSLFTHLLEEMEQVHTKFGRYNCPEEHPFTNIDTVHLVNSNNKSYDIDRFLDKRHISINNNETIIEKYFNLLLPKITEEGDDENLGSAVTADINLLQALSRRIHLGKIVAQSKYNSNKEWYINTQTDEDYFIRLTNLEVENSILERLEKKIKNFNNELVYNFPSIRFKPSQIVDIYRDFIIPETKQVQICYFKLLVQ